MGLSGIDLNAESLATLALGGVSFITPADDGPGSLVSNGHLFPLHTDVDDEWLQNSAPVSLFDVDFPETVAIEGSVPSSFLGIPGHRSFFGCGLLLSRAQALFLLTADFRSERGRDGDRGEFPAIRLREPGTEIIVDAAAPAVVHPKTKTAKIVLLRLDSETVPFGTHEWSALRSPDVPEECCVVRSILSDGGSSSVMHTVGRHELELHQDVWIIAERRQGNLSAWQGAPVVSLSDGRVIGVLVLTDRGTAVTPLPSGLLHLPDRR